ncbi:hypothetical protein E3P99_00568 [Wallemia hederae]|uniref:Coenzyme Q-binding protein COQ10 START domain-containing protein n=1 Tax=Wallemia hederae TaxID=1540922 RepID=A0A4T0FVZ8_9BASI|nr:hypothetical protein E3P99_00568 [Wallemia hederae]
MMLCGRMRNEVQNTLKTLNTFTTPITRSFISFPNLPDFSQPQTYTESKVLPYSQEKVYRLVADVNKYHEFLPYCTHSRILSSTGIDLDKAATIDAELGVGFKGYEERYTSVVTLKPYQSVIATASSQTPLFKSLKTSYTFTPVNEHTLLNINLEYAFVNPVYATLSSTFFEGVSSAMVDAFEQRAKAVCARDP